MNINKSLRTTGNLILIPLLKNYGQTDWFGPYETPLGAWRGPCGAGWGLFAMDPVQGSAGLNPGPGRV